MQYIVCPNTTDAEIGYDQVYVFMAGGITSCIDWQNEYAKMFDGVEGLTLFNPRRPAFDVRDPSMSEQQIEWEHVHMEAADAVSFWFTDETLCPITLFELGKCLALGKVVFVGAHPNYARRLDLIHQTRLMRGNGFKIHETLEELANAVKQWVPQERHRLELLLGPHNGEDR